MPRLAGRIKDDTGVVQATKRVNVYTAGTTTPVIAFDDTDVVVPFVHFVQATTTPGTMIVTLWDVGAIPTSQTAQLASQ